MLQRIKAFFTTRDRRACRYIELATALGAFFLLTIATHKLAALDAVSSITTSYNLTGVLFHIAATDVFALLVVLCIFAYKRKLELDKLNIVVITSMDIADAIVNDKIEVVLQPISRLSTGTIVGFESLVRLNHPQHGIITPDDLIPVLNNADPELARHLTACVIRKTTAFYREFLEEGYDFRMSVNLHPEDLTDGTIIATITNSLLVDNMPSDRLTVEISEKTLMRDISMSLKVLAGLDTLDIKMALDDYGTKVTSFLHFRDFLVDEVKIDNILTHRLDFNRHNAEVVQAVIHTAHSMGAYVTAKCVETNQTLAKVKELGCDFVQGYIIAPPMTFDQARVWIRTQQVSAK